MAEEKQRKPKRPAYEITAARIGESPIDDIGKLARALHEQWPMAARMLAGEIADADGLVLSQAPQQVQ